MRRIFATVSLTLAVLVPAGSRNAFALHTAYECFGTVQTGGTASCETAFPLDGTQLLSNLATHANYHTALARGPLTLSWFDARDQLVATFNCAGLGLADGLADQSSLSCTQNGEKAETYSPGTQRLVVSTTNVTCGSRETACLFHGQLSFGAEGDLY